MDSEKRMEQLITALSHNMGDRTFALSVMQSAIASEIMLRRVEKNMTQAEFAEHLGVSQSTLSKWENGDTNFTLSTLVNIAFKLGIQLQSPFVPTPSKVYQAKDNIVHISTSGNWHSCFSKTVPVLEVKSVNIEDELLEM